MSDLILNDSIVENITEELVVAGYIPNERKQYTSFSKERGDKTYLHYSHKIIRATKNTDGESVIRGFFGEPNGRASDTQNHIYSTWFFNGYSGKAGSSIWNRDIEDRSKTMQKEDALRQLPNIRDVQNLNNLFSRFDGGSVPLTITTQPKHTWKKRIQRPGLKGSTYFAQQSGKVWVAASADHQAVCVEVLGKDSGTSSLESYMKWENVSATDLVELLFQIGNESQT